MIWRYLKFNRRLHYSLLGVLAAGVVFVWMAVGHLISDLWFKVVILDVGQGDAILLRGPGGLDVLVDAGPNGRRLRQKLSSYRPFWDQKLELAVITHPDADHITGFLDLFQNFEIKTVLLTGVLHQTKTYKQLLDNIEQAGTQVILAQTGEVITAAQLPWQFKVISPFKSPVFQKVKAINNAGIVGLLTIGQRHFLLTADIESEQEKNIIRHLKLPWIDVLKVAHHGSRTSTSQEFLKSIKPALAVISVGKKNPYHHPHPDVLRRLRLLPVWQTAQAGTIVFYTDGRQLWIDSDR